MTFQQIKPSRRKAYLRIAKGSKYDASTKHLFKAHPDWLRPSEPSISQVLDSKGNPYFRYIPVERVEPIHKVHLGNSICGRFVSTLHVQGGTYWIQEHDTLLDIHKRSLNYGSGELAKRAYQMGSVSWTSS